MRDIKKIEQIRHCNIIPLDMPKLVFLEQTEIVFNETKTIFQYKRWSGHTAYGKQEIGGANKVSLLDNKESAVLGIFMKD